MLYSELQTEFFVRGGIDTTNTFTTETMCRRWLDEAHIWAAAYKKWPFTEYMDSSGTYTNGTAAYNYPNVNYKTDSIRYLLVGTDPFHKKVFTDFGQYFVDYPSGTDKMFTDYGRILYINPHCTSGTIYCFGQLTPPTLGLVESSASSTVFNNYDPEGNDAVIDKALSYASRRMRKFADAMDYENRARTTLDELWKRIQDEQAMYQTKDRSLFEALDILRENEDGNPLQF